MAEESGWLVGSRQILVNFYFTELNIEIYKNLPKAHPQNHRHGAMTSSQQLNFLKGKFLLFSILYFKIVELETSQEETKQNEPEQPSPVEFRHSRSH